MLPKNLQTGKAGEHLVCSDLIMQGFNAYLTDAGQPYDVVVDIDGRFFRVQVKSTDRKHSRVKSVSGAAIDRYRFDLRRRGSGPRKIDGTSVDVFAFAALDIKAVAYVRREELLARDGGIIGAIDFLTEEVGQRYARHIFEKCSRFPSEPADTSIKSCSKCGSSYPATTQHFETSKKNRGGLHGVCRVCCRKADADIDRHEKIDKIDEILRGDPDVLERAELMARRYELWKRIHGPDPDMENSLLRVGATEQDQKSSTALATPSAP